MMLARRIAQNSLRYGTSSPSTTSYHLMPANILLPSCWPAGKNKLPDGIQEVYCNGSNWHFDATTVIRTSSSDISSNGKVANYHSYRPLQITRHTPESSNQILIEQRKKRPISPHLEIYKRQITSVLSILHRLTGVPLSAGFYVAGIAYLAAPAFGWHIDSASIAAAFGAWPIALKVLAKFTVALPFTYHCFNGVRHLVWDLGKTITNRNVIRTGWTVVGLSVPSALYLALFV